VGFNETVGDDGEQLGQDGLDLGSLVDEVDEDGEVFGGAVAGPPCCAAGDASRSPRQRG
jgi:hypothetical protein